MVLADELVPLPGGLPAVDDGEGDRAEITEGGDGGERQGELAAAGRVAGVAAVAVAVRGGGKVIRWSAAMRLRATRAVMSLRRPPGPCQPRASQTAREISARLGSTAARPAMTSSSAGVKSRPQ